MPHQDRGPLIREMMHDRAAAYQEVITYEPEEFAATIMYWQRRDVECTPNAEGIHIGDLFSVAWDNPTRYTFFQVTGLNGQHDVIVRENEILAYGYDDNHCLARPIRDSFTDETYTITSKRYSTWQYTFTNTPGKYDESRNLIIPYNDTSIIDFSID